MGIDPKDAAILDAPNPIPVESRRVQPLNALKISGFYYPASKKFTGKRPVLINIHGGPEGQSFASSLGSGNYYTN